MPKAHFVDMSTENPFMDYSELPKGGETESFDTRGQSIWSIKWNEETDE